MSANKKHDDRYGSSRNYSYYELLEVQANVSPYEIRRAYEHIKSVYTEGNMALYTLMGSHQSKEMIRKIEEAYRVLGNRSLRKIYDERIKSISGKENQRGDGYGYNHNHNHNHHHSHNYNNNHNPDHSHSHSLSRSSQSSQSHSSQSSQSHSSQSSQSSQSHSSHSHNQSSHNQLSLAALQEAANVFPNEFSHAKVKEGKEKKAFTHDRIEKAEKECEGILLRQLREEKQISIDEMSEITKINPFYLKAVEESNLEALPSLVFVQGFVRQIAKTLGLNDHKVVKSYMAFLRSQSAKK